MPNIDVSNFLNYNSLSDHNLYCLAFVFTYRDFAQGTLGLAWVGSNSSKYLKGTFMVMILKCKTFS